MLGVVKEVPVPSEVPPDALAYHLNVPALPEAVKVTTPGPQRESPAEAVIFGVTSTTTTVALTGQLLLSVTQIL